MRIQDSASNVWRPRSPGDISIDLSDRYGLPFDLSSKTAGLYAIASALNAGNIARAQLVALHLQFPRAPDFSKGTPNPIELAKFAHALASYGFVKANYNRNQPRWPKYTPNSRGGKWSPPNGGSDASEGSAPPEEVPGIGHNQGPPLDEEMEDATVPFRALAAALLVFAILVSTTQPLDGTEDERVLKFNWHHSWPKYLGGAQDQVLVHLPKPLHDLYHDELREIAKPELGKAYYDNLPPAERSRILREVAKRTIEFDAKYGTKLYKAMLKNGYPTNP